MELDGPLGAVHAELQGVLGTGVNIATWLEQVLLCCAACFFNLQSYSLSCVAL
jgi:hypothetical protein